MLCLRNNWLVKNWWRRKSRAIRRRLWIGVGSVHSALVESLECRSVPAVTSLFNAGMLSVTSDGGDTIDLGTDTSGNMTLNGIPLVTSNGSTVATKVVTSLNVNGGPLNNVIDLSGVTLAGFSALTQVNVDGGAGNNLIIGSQFADNISGQWGNDTIEGGLGNDTLRGGGGNDIIDGRLSSDPLAIVLGTDTVKVDATDSGMTLVVSSTTGGSSTNVGQTANPGSQASDGVASNGNESNPSHTVRDLTESDPKDSHEDHSLFHLHWQKEPTHSLPLSTTSNETPAASYSPTVLASLSTRDLNWQALSRDASKLESASETSTASAQNPNDSDGLIDINAQQNSKSVARPVSADDPESSSSTSDRALIAARVAMPTAINRSKPVQPAREVPTIFMKDGDGGFIELTANVATQTTKSRSEIKRPQNLTRYDQVDAEIGRFVAFGEGELVERTLAVKRPNKVAAAELIGTDTADNSASAPQHSWKLAVTAGMTAIILQPRIQRRVTRFVMSRSAKVANVFKSSVFHPSREQRRVFDHATLSPRTRTH